MNAVVVDIDDTLVDTRFRMQRIWSLLLSREIPLEAIETLGLEQIFLRFASQDQKAKAKEFQKRFWSSLLCEEEGVESLALHAPVPYAADVLHKWSKNTRIAYLTGRTEKMRSLTLDELKRFRFPTEKIELVMFQPEDYARPKGESSSGPTLIETKARLCAELCERFQVVKVIDDYPGYFPIFAKLRIPDRIGFLYSQKYKAQQYLDRGATRVIRSWNELHEDTL